MRASKHGKRPAESKQQGPSKKRKLGLENAAKPRKANKIKAGKRETIPIPNEDGDIELSDQDLDVLDAYGDAASFLDKLDRKNIARSKNETDRLHRLNKFVSKPADNDDLPSIDSHDDDGESWSSDIDDELLSIPDSVNGDDVLSDNVQLRRSIDPDSDVEMSYEAFPRTRRPSWGQEKKNPGIQRLPIKLPDGRIQETGRINIRPSAEEEEEEWSTSSDEDEEHEERKVEDVSTGARFGRPSVVQVIGTQSRNERIQAAKVQISGICQEILAEPENSLGLLKRLHTFTLAEITSLTHPDPVINDPLIRKLAILSELIVFKDIIPGYRIRALTDKEKAEKVSQLVARTREWEQGLVTAYQSYLHSLQAELKANSELTETCLQCLCTLAVEASHFNFSTNVIGSVVTRVCRKSWDKSSDLCLDTLIKVLREDLTGAHSLEIVRLLNRTIKEKRFNVHPKLLSCLLHLRLKTELGVRASESKADKEDGGIKSYSKKRAAQRRAKGKATEQPHLSKKMKKALKEKKEIEREFREAEAEVDKEERATTHTETLKLLFVLYFSILKNPKPTGLLLPAALRGISKYAHLVNVDFFADLMQVLKTLISRESDSEMQEKVRILEQAHHSNEGHHHHHHQLQCIVTAFELLSGQGEALNIDLNEFTTRLYSIILPLSVMPDIEAPLVTSAIDEPQSVADLLFHALNIVFSQHQMTTPPSWRSAAFAKRILTACLQWPSATTLRALDFVGGLIHKDAKLEALLKNSEDRKHDGVYRADIDDPQLCNAFGTWFWELFILEKSHWDDKIRDKARGLAQFTRSSRSS